MLKDAKVTTREENELLTRTDPGTSMGNYLRSFWIPCMVQSEVPQSDEPPVRLRLLGEDLVVFRDTNGNIGVLEERCPHRQASLFFGRNEEAGLRCVYHGWKFDTAGNCLDMPNEPATSDFKTRVKAVSYPARLGGGILWVFMGAQSNIAEFPDFEWMDLPPEKLYVSRWEQECNSIQAMEGELDAAHVSFLHRRVDQIHERKTALSGGYFQEDRSPRWHVKDTDYGFIAASQRSVEEDKAYWRMNQFLLPFYTMITSEPGSARMTRMWVPKDDTHCWVIALNFRHEHELLETELSMWRNGEMVHRKVIPGTTQPIETRANDYLIDRDAQRRLTFTGIEGVRAQDAMATESAGPIVDRTKENLGTSDIAVVRMRRRLMSEAKSLRDSGKVPLPAKNGKVYRVRAHQTVLSREQAFDEVDEVLAAMRA
jgi:phthalate 4,5-dioxygenase